MDSDNPNMALDSVDKSPAPEPEGFSPSNSPDTDAGIKPIRGGNLRVIENMEESLKIPTATSYRTIPVKLLEENRRIINKHMAAKGRAKVSFTHVICWAIVQALKEFPVINSSMELVENLPHHRMNRSVNLGVAIDYFRKDGTRTLIVPNVKNADQLPFNEFLDAYNSILDRTRKGMISPM